MEHNNTTNAIKQSVKELLEVLTADLDSVESIEEIGNGYTLHMIDEECKKLHIAIMARSHEECEPTEHPQDERININNTEDIHLISYMVICPKCGSECYIDYDDYIPQATEGYATCDNHMCDHEIKYRIVED